MAPWWCNLEKLTEVHKSGIKLNECIPHYSHFWKFTSHLKQTHHLERRQYIKATAVVQLLFTTFDELMPEFSSDRSSCLSWTQNIMKRPQLSSGIKWSMKTTKPKRYEVKRNRLVKFLCKILAWWKWDNALKILLQRCFKEQMRGNRVTIIMINEITTPFETNQKQPWFSGMFSIGLNKWFTGRYHHDDIRGSPRFDLKNATTRTFGMR